MDIGGEEKYRRGGRKIVRFIRRYKILLSVLGVLSILFWCWLPETLFEKKSSTVLLDEDGQLLAAQIAADGQWRFPLEDSLPSKFEQCILSFEDEYFYYHPGVNPVSMGRALKSNFKSGKVKSGGSTITMQVARMYFGNNARGYFQKLKETLMALRIECSYSKKEILNLYCSQAPFGGNVVGLHAAAWRYFGQSPANLSWSESAVLAVLPNAPSLIYPGKNQSRLLVKRNRLLQKLLDKKIIDTATFSLALLEPLPTAPHNIPRLAPHLLEQCILKNGKSQIYKTTVKKNLQIQVSELLNNHIQYLQQNQIHNACAIVAETETGRIIAYVGNSFSATNDNQNFVDIVQAHRSTGSILKPFLYAFMMSENRILPASLIEDVPTRLGSYSPRNFNLTFDGLVPANQAIARSLNVPAIKMLQDYGVPRFHQRLAQLGFTTFSKPSAHYGLSLILGGGEASLFDIAGAYASMGRALIRYSNTRNRYATNSYHPLTYLKSKPEKFNVKLNSDLLKASALYYTFNAMTDLLRPQDYVGYLQFTSKNRIAWKTGTSFGFRDAWAVGLNSKYIVAVWVGNADGEGRPELTGTSAAAPLMFSIFNVLRSRDWFPKPYADLEKINVCAKSGFKASDLCPETFLKEYPSGASKTKACPFHQLVYLDSTAKWRVNSNCYPPHKMAKVAWFMASPLQEYFYRQHSLWYKALPPYMANCENNLSQKHLEIIYPRDGFSIYVPRTESGNKSNFVLSATHKDQSAELFWHLDGEFIGTTTRYHQLPANPEPGSHVLVVTDKNGESAMCTFSILAR